MSAALAACTLAEQQRRIDRTQQQIVADQATLDAENRKHSELVMERDRLLQDLNTRQMSAQELDARLQKIQEINAATAAHNADAIAKRDENRRQLTNIQQQIRAVEQDPRLPDPAKQRQLADLKEQTRKMLQIILTL